MMTPANEASETAKDLVERDWGPLQFTYRNWRGETAARQAIPIRVHFGSTEWHPEPQWLLEAFDTEKQAHRDFALRDMQFEANVTDSQEARLAGMEEAAKIAEGWLESSWVDEVFAARSIAAAIRAAAQKEGG